jgi:NAD(P)-dependent dehydrogenase (short-subunit alcohol dehydrogenase family)
VPTAVVTGAASGIGRALAAALVARGSDVVVADLDGAAAERTCAELGARARPAQLDVRDRDAVRELVERTDRDAGGLDLLVNNAGTGVGGPFTALTAEHWRVQLEVNLYGVVHGIEAAYPLMVARGRGQICSTSSLSGIIPAPTLGPYSTSKYAVVGLSLALRGEAATHGVRVSVLCPGYVETPLLDRPDDEAPDTGFRSIRPLIRASHGRTTTPEKVAAACLRGLDRDQAVIVTPLQARLAWRAYRLAPGLTDRVVTKTARDVLRGLPAAAPGR